MRSDFIPVDHMKLVSLNDSPWFDAMIRNIGNNQSAQRADMSSNLAYSPQSPSSVMLSIKSSLIQRLIEHEPMIQMSS